MDVSLGKPPALRAQVRTDCFDCVQNDPYNGAYPDYGYACGYCAALSAGPIRDSCFSCLRNTTGTTSIPKECLEQTIRVQQRGGENHTWSCTLASFSH